MTWSTEPLAADDTKFAIRFPFAKYRNADNTDGTSDAGIRVKLPYAEIELTISGQAYKLGDVDGDGDINTLDAALLYAYVNGRITLNAEQLARGNVTGEGEINTLDAALIYAFVNGRISSFPAEGN